MLNSIKSALPPFERQAWVRFFIALFGLTLSFSAALLSTAAREAGNQLATVILAASALLLAGVVGLTTVPYLARRVVGSRVRDAFDYEVTKEGVVYLLLTLAIGIAALNTGNNLLFVIVAAMLAAVLVSGIASAIVLRSLKLDVVLPTHIFAGSAIGVRLLLQNARRFVPAFSVTVAPPRVAKRRSTLALRRTVFVFPRESSGRRAWVRWPDVTVQRVHQPPPPQSIFQTRVYFPYIAAGDTGRAEIELNFERRGRYVQDGFGLETRFPFSFLTKTRRVPVEREIIVYPRVEPTDELFEVLPMITGEFESYVRGRGYDLYRIREYGPEDSARHVDWKATAKSGSLKVREFTREDERKLRIVFDNPAPGIVSERAYENAVEMTASLAWHFAGENTELSFAAAGFEGGSDLYRFLEFLAVVEADASKSVLDELQVTDDYNIVITARPHGSIASPLWQSSYFIFMNK